MEHTYFFAVDLGATSGRTILGCLGEGKMELKELTRFPNHIIETGGHCYWDIYALYNEIIKGLKVVAKDNLPIQSIGIDTWGDRKSTRLNSSHIEESRMPSSA